MLYNSDFDKTVKFQTSWFRLNFRTYIILPLVWDIQISGDVIPSPQK